MARRPSLEKSARVAARREELLDAAIVVLRRDGPSASMDAMAAEAGITKPILYRYFGDRDGLTRAVAARCFDEVSTALAAALTRPASPRDLLTSTIDTFVAFIEREPELYHFLFQVPHGQEEVAGFIHRVGNEVAVVLGERLREAGADSGAAEPWAFGLVGMVYLGADWWMERRTMPRARLVEYLVSMVWDGMGHVDPGSGRPRP